MSEKLLPCPFCGAPADDFNPDGDMEGYTISCSGKGAVFGANHECCPMASFSFKTHADAIKAWNTRAQQPSAAQLAEAMEGIEPYLDAIICYASTQGEHEPNRLAAVFRQRLEQFKKENNG